MFHFILNKNSVLGDIRTKLLCKIWKNDFKSSVASTLLETLDLVDILHDA
jgi:hypothetical protein